MEKILTKITGLFQVRPEFYFVRRLTDKPFTLGGRIEQKDLDIQAAAERELKEETQLELPLEFRFIVGNNYRDPR